MRNRQTSNTPCGIRRESITSKYHHAALWKLLHPHMWWPGATNINMRLNQRLNISRHLSTRRCRRRSRRPSASARVSTPGRSYRTSPACPLLTRSRTGRRIEALKHPLHIPRPNRPVLRSAPVGEGPSFHSTIQRKGSDLPEYAVNETSKKALTWSQRASHHIKN